MTNDIKAIGLRLRELRLAKNLEQTDVATYLGYKSDTTISKWENAKNLPTGGKLAKLAELFDTTTDFILYGERTQPPKPSPGSQTPSDELTEQINAKVVQLATPRKKIVLGVATAQLEAQKNKEATDVHERLVEYHVYERLSAGKGASYYEDNNYDTVYYDEDISHDLASWIWGDSMEPAYLNGEVALIKDTGFDYDGAVYAIDWAGQTYIKKVYKEKDGLRLVSLNKKYAPLFAHMDEEPRIIGKVIGHFMPFEG